MNLYSIDFVHYAPKGSEVGIKQFVLAKSDEMVLDFMLTEPEGIYHDWNGKVSSEWDEECEAFVDEYGEEYFWCNEEGEPESFRARLLRLKGEVDDDDAEVEDAYYGVTHYGWSLQKEGVTDSDIEFLKTLNIKISDYEKYNR